MTIDAIGGGAPAGASSGGAGATSEAAGFQDEFLRLLVAQLQNQNPLQPQDGAEFVAQLADFASVEQSAEMNQRLAAIEAEQATAAGAALAGFVGQNASSVVNGVLRLDPEKGPMPELTVDVPEAAEKMTATIYDETGAVVRTIELGKQFPGKVSLGWDGTNNAGSLVGAGNYRVEIEAEASDGQSIGTTLRARGAVDAIEFTNGLQMLRLGALAIPPSDVESIGV